MLAPAGPAIQHIPPNTASPTSPSRPSRLRGLSLLRSYTQDRLHSSRSDAPPLTRSTSSPTTSTVSSPVVAQPEQSITSAAARGGDTSGDDSAANLGIDTAMARLTVASSDQPVASQSAAAETAQQTEASSSRAATTSTTEQHPTIRFIPHVENRSSRPSLHFAAITKTLKHPNEVVRVGRYSDREQAVPRDGVLPVGFKSKVVSRRHCEFSCTGGQWFVKDVKSSSGTFLNHVRLSSPGVESRPFPINDGDVVQLGIDFKGGEEVIFRCVKIRIECNRGWQKALNNFNTTTHKRLLRNVTGAGKRDSDSGSSNTECSICLNPVTPCQCLFVAPCSHVWHYKCVRNLVHGPNWPNFLCPNCRFVADLEADVEPPDEDLYEDEPVSEHEAEVEKAEADHSTGGSSDEASGGAGNDDQHADQTVAITSITDENAPPLPTARGTTTQPVTVPIATSKRATTNESLSANSLTPNSNAQFAMAAGVIGDALLTPRNDAGPFIFNGTAGRAIEREALDGIVAEAIDEHEE